jgi:hypothetical protein
MFGTHDVLAGSARWVGTIGRVRVRMEVVMTTMKRFDIKTTEI